MDDTSTWQRDDAEQGLYSGFRWYQDKRQVYTTV